MPQASGHFRVIFRKIDNSLFYSYYGIVLRYYVANAQKIEILTECRDTLRVSFIKIKLFQ